MSESKSILLNPGERCEDCEQILARLDGGNSESLHEWYEGGRHVCDGSALTVSALLGRFARTAREIGDLVEVKNAAYGNSFAKAADFLKLLYPDGIRPEQYKDAAAMFRIFDKQMRIATHKTALEENPYRDIAGYGILGATEAL